MNPTKMTFLVAVVVAQLVEKLLPTQEIEALTNFIFYQLL